MTKVDIPARIKDGRKAMSTLMLTKREMQCVLLALQNKSLAQMQDSLKIYPQTIGFYLRNASRKILNLDNKMQSWIEPL